MRLQDSARPIRSLLDPLANAAGGACLALGLLAEPVCAQVNSIGQWSPLQPGAMHSVPIHMALVRGDGTTFHSRVVWTGYDSGPAGGVLGWRANNVGCGSFPDTNASNPNANLIPLRPWGTNLDLFCGGQTTLADGSLLSVGGTYLPNWGIHAAVTYPPGVIDTSEASWTIRAPMKEPRWYPTATLLRDGRVLTAAGTKYDHMWFYGGRRDGHSPKADSGGHHVERLGRVNGGKWDPSLATLSGANGVMPVPREGHTLVTLTDLLRPVLFGGSDSAGSLVANPPTFVWTLDRKDGGAQDQDYRYEWLQWTIAGTLHPTDRTEHTALAVSATTMLVFGGTTDTSQAFWRLFKDGLQWRWGQVVADSGSPPPVRFGHAAVYDTHTFNLQGTPTLVRRMIVYGGASTLNGAPTDSNVYIFTFSGAGFTNGNWSNVSPGGGPPPLYDHTMTLSPHPWASNPPNRRIAWIYGGWRPGGSTSPVLWRLHLGAGSPSEITWASHTPAGPSPGPRVGHTMYLDPLTRQFSLFGGSADKHLYQLENQLPWDDSLGHHVPPWTQGAEASNALAGHAVCFDPISYKPVARIPEIYNPTTNTWVSHPAAARSGQYYPQQFLVPRSTYSSSICRVVLAGDTSRYLDVPSTGLSPAWATFPNNQPGFSPFTSVQYRPGRILAAGGYYGQQVTNRASTLAADVIPGGTGWQQSSTMSHARQFHNLVLLPNGHVLAVGGMASEVNGVWEPSSAKTTPEWWNPANGAWTSLAAQTAIRNYHSTALLLPDGRVLSGGGWWYDADTHQLPNPNMQRMEIFCPPYLFKNASGDPAARPVINGTPDTLTWGQRFTVCVQDTTEIGLACLIRAGATTHGLDMSQRFVPLTIEGQAGNPQRLFLSAPASPDSAPPGDYLLFLLGSAERDDVPSIARWVRLQGTWADKCDVLRGAKITDLTPDIVTSTSISMTWTATADDSVLPVSGRAQRFLMRRASSYIDTEAEWDIAQNVGGLPTPGSVGTLHDFTVEFLQPCTAYHFMLRGEDDKPHLSGFHGDVFASTLCGGGGGGGFSAHEARGEETGAAAAASGAAPMTLQAANRTLFIETRRAEEGAWKVLLRLVSESGASGSPGSAITVEREDASGGRDTLGRFTPGETETLLGLCALRDRGRIAVPAFSRVERVESRVRSRDGAHRLASAVHSRLGDLGAELVAAADGIDLAPGDSLDLTYAPAADSLADATSWYALVRRVADAPQAPMSSRRGSLGETLPTRFALHPNRPNPFRGTTVIAFDLPVESQVSLAVFDVLGRRVATLVSGTLPAGTHRAEWDLRTISGAHVAPGVYTYRMIAGTYREQRKMTVLP